MILIIFILTILGVFFLVTAFIPRAEEAALSARLERIKRRRERVPLASTVLKYLRPFLTRFASLLIQIIPSGYLDGLNQKMEMAGERKRTIESLLAEKIGTTLVFFAIILAGLIVFFNVGTFAAFFFAFLIALVGFFIPDFQLTSKIKKRHYLIQRELGDTLDQLTTSVQAGLGFNAALQYVIQGMPESPLREEFEIMLSELRLGKKRTEALRAMGARTQHSDLNLVAITIAHGEELGTPITQTLQALAEEVRRKRWDEAEEKASKAPVLIVIPTIFLILPTLFVIIFGPFVLYYLLGGG